VATSEDLIKAIRTGKLSAVIRALAAGAPVELNDGRGEPGLPLGIACFMGYVDIVRELLQQGAKANLPDNHHPASPLSMALRGKHTEVVRLLVEQGAEVPPDMQTGLSVQELVAAEWQAHRNGKRAAPPSDATDEKPAYEEIVMSARFGVDTTVLEADVIKAAIERERKRKESS